MIKEEINDSKKIQDLYDIKILASNKQKQIYSIKKQIEQITNLDKVPDLIIKPKKGGKTNKNKRKTKKRKTKRRKNK